MTLRTLASALLAALALPSLASPQEGPSIFSVLDTGGRSIGPAPALEQGVLADADPLSGDARRVQAWQLTAAPGDELQVDLRSDDFDAYVYVVGPGLGGGISDDDGGENLDSRICLAVSEAGEYRVVASSLSGETGAFTLEVRRRVGATSGACAEEAEAADFTDSSELPVDGRILAIGDDEEGTLDSTGPTLLGSPAQAWEVEGRAGGAFSVDLLSEDFDAYLELEGPGLDEVLSDDDGAGRCDSRITLTFPEAGTYRLVVTTLGGATGEYRLVATEAPGPVDPISCIEARGDTPPAASDPDDVAIVGSLQVGGTYEATMTGSDSEYGSSFMQAWTLAGTAGDRLAIDNVSEDFDSYLYLVGPGFVDAIYDDDSADNLDARICVEIPETAQYRVLAGPLSGAHEGGRYTLTVRRDGLDGLCSSYEMTPAAADRVLAELPSEGRNIGVGDEREGFMDPSGIRHPGSDRVVQPWDVELAAGREVSVDVVSDAFDPVLYVSGPGLDEPLYVDDGADGVCNSRVTFTPSAAGRFRLLPGAYYDGGGGAFRLRVSDDPPDLESGGCVSPDDGTAGSAASAADVGPLAGLSAGIDRTFEIGTEVEGMLGEGDEALATGEPAEVWSTEARAGDEIVFELLSDDFDCILFVDDGLAAPLRDDDGAGNLDSRVVFTATQDGPVRVVVSALSAGNAGAFTLRAILRAR